MEIIGILLLIIVALFALGIWQTIAAKRQHETVTTLSPARLRALVDDSFGKLFWAETDGPGDLNFRRRTPNGSGATISIDFETTADGKTVVQAWMSHWQSRMGMVASGGWGMAKKIIRKIDQATA
ncbi:hypothetical protein [Microbacterium sp. NPDC076895]|uniref:hypothetical protein n=1 Tax=Microbacterium sp. NPDC076895 TaxID=3154957 RepID=UPI00342174DF